MGKKLLLLVSAVIALIIIGFLTFIFRLKYEPAPSSGKVEEMVDANDLVAFGDVEGSYLYTPRNYGYYNEKNIYIVEKSFGDGEQYDDHYVVIKQGEEITDNPKSLVEQINSKYSLAKKLMDVRVISKHKIQVYKNNEKVKEEWFYKVTFAHGDDDYLSFISPAEDVNDRFNFFTKGYEQFLNF
ncbi:hypothetical protein V1502_16405 [Bacillus sp. SCS-153A]|uniref:hypothetical protein n=1 Tax=Rossellomorea sedimentorum TaxID=3115294 RepID=UPI003906AEE2